MSFALYLITEGASPRIIERTEAALRGAPPGAVAVQARAKGAGARALADLAAALRLICRAAGAPLLVNDRADVAQLVGADGVHLPEAGLTVDEARTLLGPSALIGRSCHDRAGLDAAQRAGADFATLGPIFAVPGKGAPLGLDGFRAAVDGLDLPTYALGGVDASRADAFQRVAVIRAVYASADPASAVRAMLAAMNV